MSEASRKGTSSCSEKYRDAHWLREQYWREEKSQSEIADMCGVSQRAIQKWMEKHEISTRDQSEAHGVPKDSPLRDGDWLRSQYWDYRNSIAEIANRIGVSKSAVLRWMEKHDIRRRSQSEAHSPPPDSPLRDEEWLCEEYVEKKRSAREIAESLDAGSTTVCDWLNRHGIVMRVGGPPPGERHPNWEGGYSRYYGASWKRQRQKAIQRDGYKCVRCGMTEDEHQNRHENGLNVHHIRSFDEFEDHEKANRLENLITLCKPCHVKLEGVPIDNRNITTVDDLE